jgi:hypothetical protein
MLFEQATEDGEAADFQRILGNTGGGDRLLIVYNGDRLDLVSQVELTDINIEGRVRAPLVAHFRLKPAGPELLFMVNHLYRGNAEGRHEQARLLNAWARGQTIPVIEDLGTVRGKVNSLRIGQMIRHCAIDILESLTTRRLERRSLGRVKASKPWERFCIGPLVTQIPSPLTHQK